MAITDCVAVGPAAPTPSVGVDSSMMTKVVAGLLFSTRNSSSVTPAMS